MTTRQNLIDCIEAGREDPEGNRRVLGALRGHNGKKLDKRMIPALCEAAGCNVIIRRQYGMIHIESERYYREGHATGVRFTWLLAHSETLPEIDVADIVERNPAFFLAAEKRNAEREAAIADADMLDSMAETIDAYNKSRAELVEMFRGPLDVASTAIREAFISGEDPLY